MNTGMRRSLTLAAAALVALLAPRDASAESPQLVRVTPRGGQRGTELDVVFGGARLKDVQGVFLYKPGIEVLKLEAQGDAAVKARLRIAPDAALGEHPVRLRTATGITELRTFFVGPFPAVEEKEPNGEFRQPQKIELNTTVAGVVTLEDVDCYAVELKKGQRLTVEVEGMRLGGGVIFDPHVAILDAKRFEVASSDDSALLLQDPVASVLAPEDGTFVIQVRETSYGGNDSCLYRLHVGTFPRPLAIFPPGGLAGEEVAVTLIGDAKGPIARTVKLPGQPSERFPVWVEEDGATPPSPNWMRVSEYPNVLENEPNDTLAQATATDLPLPVALNGVIGKSGDLDWYRFKAKAGQDFEVRAFARAIRSPLDAVLAIHRADGAQIAINDDQGGPDPILRFRAPADGEYAVLVRDHLKGGSPAHVYRVEFNAVKPGVYAHIPAYLREPQGQHRQAVVVPRGNRFATWIRVNRVGFGGDMTLSFEGLPPGMTAHAPPVAAAVDRVPVVFEAAPDAPIGGSLAGVTARFSDANQKVEGGFRQDVNLVFGPPNNTIYYATAVNRLACAVAEEVPFRIRVVGPKVPLVRGGSMDLKVVAERKAGFDKPITLRLLWSPPGVGAAATITMAQGQSEALYPINADGAAPATSWKLTILGEADDGNGPIWVSTPLADLAVAPPYLAMKIEMTAVEQGRSAEVVCKLEHQKPFEGKAKVVLQGLPGLVTAESTEREITRDEKEIQFKVAVDAKTVPGQHKTLFCQVYVPENGETICHNVGLGGILRIDPAPPPKKEAAAASKPGEPSPPASAGAKKLSRLEQLRLEAEQKAKEEKK